MKSFAVFAAVAGVAVAQNLGSCAQLCADNMARIANTQFSCAAGDIGCFCGQSNWAYGIRDCSAQACDAEQAAQAVTWANGQCSNAAQSGSVPAAIPILTGAIASASEALATATGAPASGVTSLASEATDAASSAASQASDVAASASDAIASAASSASDALASVTNSIASEASGRASSLLSVVNSATSRAGDVASSTQAAGAAKMTGLPLAGAAGLAAWLLL